jgi:hypothetical protein
VNAPLCHCGRPSPDAFLCDGCTRALTRILAELPSQLLDLQVTETRQSRTSRGDAGSHPTKKAAQPLPFDVAAATVAEQARSGLGSWARHLAEARGVECPQLATVPAMARFLFAHVGSIRQDELAGDMLAAMRALRQAIVRCVDAYETRFVGPCTAQVPDVWTDGDRIVFGTGTHECGQDLRLRVGADRVQCNAKDPARPTVTLGCGAEYTAAERWKWIMSQAADFYATVGETVRILRRAGYHVNIQQVTRMLDQGRVYPWREDDEGQPLLRLGDFTEILGREGQPDVLFNRRRGERGLWTATA